MDQNLMFAIEPDSEHQGRFVLSGELDMATAPGLLATVEGAFGESVRDVVFDVRSLSFVDSTGLSALIQIAGRLEGGTLTLLAPADNVARVLKLVRADAFPNVRVVWED